MEEQRDIVCTQNTIEIELDVSGEVDMIRKRLFQAKKGASYLAISGSPSGVTAKSGWCARRWMRRAKFSSK